MSSITAAIVGVVLNLAVWFALHTVFGSLRDVYILGGPPTDPGLEYHQYPDAVDRDFCDVGDFPFQVGGDPDHRVQRGPWYHLSSVSPRNVVI